MEFEFQEGRNIDPNQLHQLFQHAPWAKERTVQEIERSLENSDLVISIWREGRLVGFARVLTDYTFRAMVYDVVVHPGHQRGGLGRFLIEKILNHPTLSTIPVISLFTRDKIDFYERLGFKTAADHGITGMLYVRPVPTVYC